MPRSLKLIYFLALVIASTAGGRAQCVPASTAAGSLDPCFGIGGKVITDITPDRDFARAMAIQPDGKIVVAGIAGYSEASNNADFLVVRYNIDGSLDTTFDGDGIVVTDFGFGTLDDDYCRAIVIQPDGKIVVAGRSVVGPQTYGLALIRYRADGSLDTTFDGDGKAHFAAEAVLETFGLALQSDGKFVVGGRSFGGGVFGGLIVRFNSNGSIDTTFGNAGMTTGSISGVFAVAVQSDGKILAAGTQGSDPLLPAFAVTRLHPDGSPDLSFGVGGVVTHHPTFTDQLWFVRVRFDDQIFIGGHSSAMQGDARATLLRFAPSGGLAREAIYPDQNTFWNITFQPDGKVLTVGASHDPVSGFMIRRYTDANLLDTTFNGGGSHTKFLPEGVAESSGINAIAMTRDNKIVAAGSVTEQDNTATGWRLTVARFHSGLQPPHPERFDFDGDRQADLSIYRPSNGQWWIRRSSNGDAFAAQFGSTSDRPVAADYTGDGKTDMAIWRESTGEWFILRSEDFTYYSAPFGVAGDVPRPSDFDGDGKTDLIVYRSSEGRWYRVNNIGIPSFRHFGTTGDRPVTGDFDGDGKSDPAVFRPSAGEWSYQSSLNGNAYVSIQWGLESDVPTPADFDGDSKTDFAVYRSSTGTWYVINSSNGSFSIVSFGLPDDKPVPADYDGDGRSDVAVFRPSTGVWYLMRSTAGFEAIQFGLAGDIPTPAAFLP